MAAATVGALLCAGCSAGAATGPSEVAAVPPSAAPSQVAAAHVPPAASPPAAMDAGLAPPKPREDDTLSPCGEVPPRMACIPAGPFVQGVDDDPHRCTQHGQPASFESAAVPAHVVQLSAYLIDRFEVTNEAYEACVAAGRCQPAGALYPGFRAARQPVTGISWHQADRFCRAQGKRLPTEAEWEKAARGPDGDTHPWGTAPTTCERAIIRDEAGRSCGARVPGVGGHVGRIAEVGSRPAGRYGLYDMMGNAEEWVADWWTPSYLACGDACLGGPDPRGPCAGHSPCPGHLFRVVRGGSWYWTGDHATGYHRRRHTPSNEPFHHFGFRCAADPVKPADRAAK